MTKFSLIFIISLLVYKADAQQSLNEEKMRMNINSTTELMASYYKTKNFKQYAEFIYEPMLKLNGGVEKFVQDLGNEIKGFEKDSFNISNMTFENISKLIHEKTQIQCTIVEKMELTAPNFIMTLKSTIIGVSKDAGNTWKFVDPFGTTLDKLRIYLPELSSSLIIPKQEEPTITEK